MGQSTVEEIQRAVRRNQLAGEALPSRATEMLLVDRGELVLASDATDRNVERLTEVPQDVFN